MPLRGVPGAVVLIRPLFPLLGARAEERHGLPDQSRRSLTSGRRKPSC